MLLFSFVLFSFFPLSHPLGDFGCFGVVDGPVAINQVVLWTDFAQNPAIFYGHLFANADRYRIAFMQDAF